jgi:spore germination protein GerM
MEIIGSINLLGISFDGVGTVADWVNIIATVITIIFTIRHFSKINKVKIRIRAHSEINDEGKK